MMAFHNAPNARRALTVFLVLVFLALARGACMAHIASRAAAREAAIVTARDTDAGMPWLHQSAAEGAEGAKEEGR